ncbi:hypothetical protein [Streptomyces sp. NPDC059262]
MSSIRARPGRMDWLPLLSTLTGAAIGIVATLIADRSPPRLGWRVTRR